MEGPTLFRKNINMTHRQWKLEHWFALFRLARSRWQHVCIGSPYIALLSFACGDFTERNWSKNFLWGSCGFLPLQWSQPVGEPCSFFWIELPLLVPVWYLPGGLNFSCWFLCGVCPVAWTAAAGLYLVFTSRLHWEQLRLESPQRTISKQVHFPIS